MGLTGRLELRKSTEGRYRVTSRDVPDRHQISTTLFNGVVAASHLDGNRVIFDTADGVGVEYRVLPSGADSSRTVVDLVLVGSSADTDDAVGGQVAFDEWRRDGAVYTPRDRGGQ